MRLASEIVDCVRREHGKNVAAIGIYGSTAISSSMPYSDLDMTIVTHEDIGSQTKCYAHLGMPIQLDYQTIAESMEESSTPGEGGCWDSFLVLYDPDNTVVKLRDRYDRLSDADYAAEFKKRMGDHILTYIGKARNAVLSGDRSHLVGSAYQLGVEVCRALGVLNRVYVTGAMNLIESAKAMAKLPSGFGATIDVVMGNVAASDQDIYEACEDLWQGMVVLAETNQIDSDLMSEGVHC